MITILLASYNGEKYIAEQIESLLGQTVQDFRLFICDDHSTDATFSIASEYAKKYPEKIFAYQNQQNSGSAKNNFMKMMIEHKDDYIMLCDQDDVWLPDKIEKTLALIKKAEEQFGKNTPLVSHCDLKVVDKNLNVISPSYRKFAICDYNDTSLNHLLTQNFVTGATICYNCALGDIVRMPDFTMMHDMWIAMIAAAFGKIVHSDEALMLYRQHGNNELGAKNVRSLSYKLKKLTEGEIIKARLAETYKQAEAFSDAYPDMLSDNQKYLIAEYCKIPQMNKFSRINTLIRLKTMRSGISPKLGHILFV